MMGSKENAQELLDELPETKAEDLSDWNVRAETLLVFEAMRQHCTNEGGE